MRRYGLRLAQAMNQLGNVCVGIDPHSSQLDAWGLSDNVQGLRTFALTLVEAMAGQVPVVKPQSAFFERFGSSGIKVLEEVLTACRQAGLLTILDVKRGDIGSTMAGYAQAYLASDSPLSADAITVSPYLGFGSLEPALELAKVNGKGVYVLALTSNPQGYEVQHAKGRDGKSVAASIISQAEQANNSNGDEGHISDIGLVVGATTGNAARELGIDFSTFSGSVLSPGIGAQGARPADIQHIFGESACRVLASTSRGISSAGPELPSLQAAARQITEQMSDIFRN
ncbi:orotidine-5'-phosphate decarboxylase [Varibaculum vaginae]|uniref:orotidine-5'-phosphate decarboxylase n=1 Tax=Varibaculum vaginae TaxID=2364797 RepID=UPI000F08FD7C|nr:orotidine-5'-phosphate decarboxylase [Varibaculum vaginae]